MEYSNLASKAFRLYNEGKYIETYQFVTDHRNDFNEYGAHIYNLRYCTACMTGQMEQALNLMKEAILGHGYWYSYDYLFHEEDLVTIRDRDEFKELADICRQRELEAIASVKSDMLVLKPVDFNHDEKYPLMIILHGNGQNMLISKDSWASDGTKNFILAFPQSSQITFSGAYVWNDYRKGCDEVKSHYQRLLSEKYIDNEKVIICGFSAGTRTALYSILSESVNVKGFIFSGSWLPELDEWEPLFHRIKSKEIKGYIICGDMDKISMESTKKLAELLEKKGIKFKLHYIKDMWHEYPEDFDKYLDEAIDFISTKD